MIMLAYSVHDKKFKNILKPSLFRYFSLNVDKKIDLYSGYKKKP